MDPKTFSEEAPGNLLRVNLPDATHAFIPAALPPALELVASQWQLVVKARTALSDLNGVGENLPNAELLLYPLRRREALKSSSLEGTYATPEEVLIYERDPREAKSSDDRINSQREVSNYGRALQVWSDTKKDLPLSLRLIRKLHAVLMDGVRGSDHTPGEFRRTQNQIGRPPRYVPPPVIEMHECLSAFEKFLHNDTISEEIDPLAKAFLVHYQFEAIHPFLDGNGRVGRLLLSITINEWCDLSQPWLYMSPYFDRNRDKYIDLLLKVSTRGEWLEWLEFCLIGVEKQARDSSSRCRELLELREDYKKRLSPSKGNGGKKNLPLRFYDYIDSFFKKPLVRISDLREISKATYPTCNADAKQLMDKEILEEIPDQPVKTFRAREIMDITYRDIA